MISLMVNDPQLAHELIADRQARQIDRYDEVWDDIYIMSPLANNEHQSLATELSAAIATVVDWRNLGRTLTGANVSNRRDDWTRNYRIPDILVFRNDTTAEDCDTHWIGGPDLAIEIVSPGDRTLDKLDFYADVGTKELLVIDRNPWQLTLYRINIQRNKLVPVAVSCPGQPGLIQMETFPLVMQFDAEQSSLKVIHSSDQSTIRSIPMRLREA